MENKPSEEKQRLAGEPVVSIAELGFCNVDFRGKTLGDALAEIRPDLKVEVVCYKHGCKCSRRHPMPG
jgi:hypothetical protein